MPALRFLAGPTAYQKIEQRGLKPELFSQLLAASGGPKWIGIAGLDKYLFGEFFRDRKEPLHTLGASSGAWRLACLAQDNPLSAYARLEELYIGQRYDIKPTAQDVSDQVKVIISGLLGDEAGRDIVGHQIIKSHFLACRGKHLNRLSSRLALGLGLATTATANLISRRSLGFNFERFLFSSFDASSPFNTLNDLPSKHIGLSEDNIAQVLLATGSIPWVLAPVTDISGAPRGHYYDGGITDYHFDLPLSHAEGLTIYPHFYSRITPGWFDKSLPWRKAKTNYHNALIVVPSDEYLASLPYGKLPDRSDFKYLCSEERMAYWHRTITMSEVLADEFAEVMARGAIMDRLEPFY
ncbi:alpha/beta hydrolase [Shewanella psychropiezotolerans]|uniref:Alpha/beta hydrolase n=1 Tax=Shewanella psychropiezotolerans TaxID=2593655 RepID=A0ABX5X3A7_9GAMM|nr:patatin-like phospholipase family protein [Shewanella psychropiezotolerans]QDO85842.1 alpha/beta hydrolase [Shewanella psychropiezotolerans]